MAKRNKLIMTLTARGLTAEQIASQVNMSASSVRGVVGKMTRGKSVEEAH